MNWTYLLSYFYYFYFYAELLGNGDGGNLGQGWSVVAVWPAGRCGEAAALWRQIEQYIVI